MRLVRYSVIICIALIAAGLTPVKAKHLVGGSLTYEYLGQNTFNNNHEYKLELTMYRDAANPLAPEFDGQISIGIYEDNQPYRLQKTENISIIDRNGEKVEPPSGGSNCSFQPNVQIYKKTYTTTIELPPSTDGYHLNHIRCCRNNTLVNLINDMGQTYYAYIPPTSKQNSSPDFSDIPTPYICADDTTNISYQATDPDGDSLAYSFVVPYDGGGPNDPKPGPPTFLTLPINTVTYSNGYSFGNPFGNNGIARINSKTGLTTLKTPQKGRYALAVEVREYRNGNLLSTTRRDIQIIGLDCPDNPRPNYSVPNGPDKTEFTLPEGDTLDLKFQYQDDDSMYLTHDGPVFDEIDPPRAEIDSVSGKGTITTNFTWPTACGQARNRPYIFTMNAQDKGCPPKRNITKITVNVQSYDGSRVNGVDSSCVLSDSVLYTANIGKYGKDSVFWQVNGGNIVDGQHSDSILVNWQKMGKNKLEAYTRGKNGCRKDTATFISKVFKSPSGQEGPDKTLCSGDTVQLGHASPDTLTEFLWLDSQYLNKSNIPNPKFTAKNPSDFSRTIDLAVKLKQVECEIIDTVSVTIYPRPEIQEITGETSPCYQGTNNYQINSFSATNYNWSIEGGTPADTSTAKNNLDISWGVKDSGQITGVVENRFGCISDSFDKSVYVQNPVIDTILGNPVVCPNSKEIRYWVDSQPGSQYTWVVKSGNIVAGQGNGMIRVNWSDSGLGSVKVFEKDKEGCVSDTFTLPVKISYQLETSPISGDTSVCEFSDHSYGVRYTNGSSYDWWVQNGDFTKFNPENAVDVSWKGADRDGLVKVLETSYDSVNNKVCKGDTVYQPVTINPNPNPSTINGPDTFCEEEKGLFEINGFANSNFKWSFDEDAIKMVKNRNDAIQLRVNEAGAYTIEAIEITEDSCVSGKRVHDIFVKEKPVSRSILGKDTICKTGKNQVTYTYSGNSSSTFKWEIQGGTITQGNGGKQIKVDWEKPGQNSLQTFEIRQNGCSSDTINKPVILDLLSLNMEQVSTLKSEPGKIGIKWEVQNQQFFEGNKLSLWRKDSQQTKWQNLADYDNDIFYHEDSTVNTKELAYDYQIRTTNICGNTVESRRHRSVLLSSSKPSEKTLDLSWSPYLGWMNGVETYEIYRRTSIKKEEGYQYELQKTVPGDETRAQIQRTDQQANQCYRVKAIKNGGSHYSWSNEICESFPPYLYVPNAFSPWDNNGVNDEFNVVASNLVDFNMKIYTRWGEKVFESDDPDKGWDGMYKDEKAPAGTYLVIIKYEGYQLTKVYEGTVHLMR